jgi:hypothetical protein
METTGFSLTHCKVVRAHHATNLAIFVRVHAITVLVLVAIVLVSSSLELDKKIVVDRRKFIMLMP